MSALIHSRTILGIYQTDFSYVFSKKNSNLLHSPEVKDMLVYSAFIPIRRPDFAEFAKDFPTVGRKILLSGPAGKFIPLSPKTVRMLIVSISNRIGSLPGNAGKSTCQASRS